MGQADKHPIALRNEGRFRPMGDIGKVCFARLPEPVMFAETNKTVAASTLVACALRAKRNSNMRWSARRSSDAHAALDRGAAYGGHFESAEHN